MSEPGVPSPLADPATWDLVADGYLDENVPMLVAYARDAVRALGIRPGTRVLDVAAGPGTFAVEAALAGGRVHAIDFSPEMIDRLRERAAAAGVAIEARVGDGHALPYADRRFDTAASMFGLFLFADRARGLAELRRVLLPGGRVAVASWGPRERVPALTAMMDSLRRRIPDMPGGELPLSDPAAFRAELETAGFTRVDIVAMTHHRDFESVDALWRSMERSCVGLALFARSLGAAWPRVRDEIRDELAAALGDGAQRLELHAWLGTGQA